MQKADCRGRFPAFGKCPALLYDAIIVGRRGVSGLAEVLVGSVSATIVDNSELLPVWVVS